MTDGIVQNVLNKWINHAHKHQAYNAEATYRKIKLELIQEITEWRIANKYELRGAIVFPTDISFNDLVGDSV